MNMSSATEHAPAWSRSTYSLPLTAATAQVVFERALIVRDLFTGGKRSFASSEDARDFRQRIYDNHGLELPHLPRPPPVRSPSPLYNHTITCILHLHTLIASMTTTASSCLSCLGRRPCASRILAAMQQSGANACHSGGWPTGTLSHPRRTVKGAWVPTLDSH